MTAARKRKPMAEAAPLTIITFSDLNALSAVAEGLAKAADRPLYRTVARAVLSSEPGETTAHIDRQVALARPARAILLLDEADCLFARDTGTTTADEGMVDPVAFIRRFEGSGVPLILAVRSTGGIPLRTMLAGVPVIEA